MQKNKVERLDLFDYDGTFAEENVPGEASAKMKPESKGGAYLQKRTWSIGVLLLLVVFLLTGGGSDTPEMEFARADEAKEALSTASTIEIYTDLYSKRRETKILADGKVAGYVKWNTVYIDDQEWFSVEYTSDIKGGKSATGYGYYDAEGNCLGYA